jgi:hypothetical protein
MNGGGCIMGWVGVKFICAFVSVVRERGRRNEVHRDGGCAAPCMDAMRWYAVVVTGHCGGDGGDDVVRPFLLREIWARLSRLVWIGLMS